MNKEKFKQIIQLKPAIGDAEDGQKSHLIGLNFSRAWCYANLSNIYPEL